MIYKGVQVEIKTFSLEAANGSIKLSPTMTTTIPDSFIIHEEVRTALAEHKPVLALESTIISHGMPYPDNLKFARQAEAECRDHGAIPATIAILDGMVHIGLDDAALEKLARGDGIEKVATRDLGLVLARRKSGATTVSATMYLAHLAGIQVFATGGIGGVHRGVEQTSDISLDLKELGEIPVIVISAGAKAILDLPRTLEYLETAGVPVLGYQTDEFPAFYSRKSGLTVPWRVDSPVEIASMFKSQLSLGMRNGVLIANPVPEKFEIPAKELNPIIEKALFECEQLGIRGKAVTPYLLGKVVELTDGRSLATNIELALNNIRLGAQIAKTLTEI